MKVTDVEIHTGKPDFQYEPIRRLEAKCEASHGFASAPSMDEVNTRLRALAAQVGANAIVEVTYESGVSMTSWRALWGRGLAVRRISDERPCPVCAEVIKRAAVKCRFCGADVIAEMPAVRSQPAALAAPKTSAVSQQVESTPPLTTSDAMPGWVWILIGAIALLSIIPILQAVS